MSALPNVPAPDPAAGCDRNLARDEWPNCLRCGRHVRNGYWVVMVSGGGEICHPSRETEFATTDPGFLGAQPIGPECARHVPAGYLVPMVQQKEES